MYRLLLGIVVGYLAKEKIRQGLKFAVKGAIRLKRELASTYATIQEDIMDAIIEEETAQLAPDKLREKSVPQQ